MKTIKNILLVLSTGYIFFYFSERLFWARFRPEDSAAEWLWTWLAYSLMAYVFLFLVSWFRVKNIWGIFLAGAAFGWLGEGVIVQTTYEDLPLSISFTALAWHALITVWVGWYALRLALLRSTWATVKWAAWVGVGFGFWAINWWLEPDGGVSTLAEFAAHLFLATLIVVPAYGLANWSSSERFAPPRWMTWLAGGFFALAFVAAAPAAPSAAIILPVLLGLVYLGLRRNRLNEKDGSLLDVLQGPVPAGRLLALFILPLTGTLVYAGALALDLQWQTNWLLYLVTTPLGFILFGVGFYKMFKGKPSGGSA
ncbi:MAG: hypothetical protein HZB18_11125 [Chloroflexi bacterium]|nr:hypothetical protein [Chloroflexota bacterium]